MLKDGQVMRSGGVSVQADTKGEWLLNVRYLQKNREGLIPAGHVVAKAQLALTEYQAPSMELKNVEESNQAVVVPRIKNENQNRMVVEGTHFNIQFNKQNGYMDKYEVNGVNMIKDGEALTPNFWRAPTDNDFGAMLQQKYVAWKNPGMKLL